MKDNTGIKCPSCMNGNIILNNCFCDEENIKCTCAETRDDILEVEKLMNKGMQHDEAIGLVIPYVECSNKKCKLERLTGNDMRQIHMIMEMRNDNDFDYFNQSNLPPTL